MTLFCVLAVCGIHFACWCVQMFLGFSSGICSSLGAATCAAPASWGRIINFSLGEGGFSVWAILDLAPDVLRAFTAIFWMDYTWMANSGYITIDVAVYALKIFVLAPFVYLFYEIIKSRLSSRGRWESSMFEAFLLAERLDLPGYPYSLLFVTPLSVVVMLLLMSKVTKAFRHPGVLLGASALGMVWASMHIGTPFLVVVLVVLAGVGVGGGYMMLRR